MIECSCSCDIETNGAFVRFLTIVREYRICGECGDAIRPWETHTVGLWWSCDGCEQHGYYMCEDDEHDDQWWCDGDEGDGCVHGKDPSIEAYMCEPCTRACDQLLCGCWYFGENWERIADINEMSLAECIG